MLNRRDLLKRVAALGLVAATPKLWALDQTMMGSGTEQFIDVVDNYNAMVLGDIVEFPIRGAKRHFDAGRGAVTLDNRTGKFSLAKPGDPVFGWLDYIGNTPIIQMDSSRTPILRMV